jgi:hypothetical protein
MTTRKKTTSNEPTAADFDDWSPEDEQQALASVAAGNKIRHIIKNGQYWALAPHGRIYKLPLSLSINDFERLDTAQNDSESIKALEDILSAFAGDDQAEALKGEPIQVVMNLLSDFGDVIARSQGAELGKSTGSSDNSANTNE